MKFIDLQRQYQAYKDEIDQAISRVINSCGFILGPEVEALEHELSRFTGAPFAIGVSSGTDGLLLALMALDIGPGDIVLTTPFSFFATVETILLLRARPVFVDIDPTTFNLDPRLVESTLDSLGDSADKVKALVVVSLYGLCPDMDSIKAACQDRDIWIIEDACQSLGASYRNRMSCNLSPLAVTSFFPAKPLGAFGDGGMVFTRDEELFHKIKALRVHGDTGRYQHKYLGLNARLDAIQAAILRVKLRHFNSEIELRQEVAQRYMDLLEPLEQNGLITLPKIPGDQTSVFAQFTIRVHNEKRSQVIEALAARQIPTAIHYPRPLHLLRPLRELGFKPGDFPQAEAAAQQVLSLPMHPFITEEEQEKITQIMTKVLG